MENEWMAVVNVQVEIQVSSGGQPSTVKLNAAQFPKMRVISQLR